jgi:uncharacterized protein (DUF1684 family)
VRTARGVVRGVRCGVLGAAIVALSALACSSGPSAPDDESYVEKISTERARKERMFRESSDTPIPAGRQSELLPLSYFPVEPEYNASAVLKLSQDRPEFEMPTSTGKLRKMQRVGVLEFTLKGQPLSLGAFVESGTARITRLFVPFTDLTTGTETYAAGRYLDLDPTGTGLYEIDFNRAYNPYCAYNESYDCPYPPASNRLKIPIRAGERMKSASAALSSTGSR